MASGHVYRDQRPNTWLHRPSLRREDSPCHPGAVHTWPFADIKRCLLVRLLSRKRTSDLRIYSDADDLTVGGAT